MTTCDPAFTLDPLYSGFDDLPDTERSVTPYQTAPERGFIRQTVLIEGAPVDEYIPLRVHASATW